MASIMKNYSEHEQFIFNFSFSIKNMNNLRSIGNYIPAEVSVLDGMLNHLHGVHVDMDDDVPSIYDVASCHIMELRGSREEVEFSRFEMHQLVMWQICEISLAPTDNLLASLYSTYYGQVAKSPRHKYKHDFMGWLDSTINDDYQDLVEEMAAQEMDDDLREIFEEDLMILKKLVVPPFKFE